MARQASPPKRVARVAKLRIMEAARNPHLFSKAPVVTLCRRIDKRPPQFGRIPQASGGVQFLVSGSLMILQPKWAQGYGVHGLFPREQFQRLAFADVRGI